MTNATEERIYKALILNDYEGKEYATWVYEQIKTDETRYRRTAHRGNLIICKGKTNSVGPKKGMALCIVNLYDCLPMTMEHEKSALVEYQPNRFVWRLKDWRYFSEPFEFRHHKVAGTWQGIFDLRIPDYVTILTHQP
jgi:hypothetical protein